jgi:diacylglycerol kinase family enzyme
LRGIGPPAQREAGPEREPEPGSSRLAACAEPGAEPGAPPDRDLTAGPAVAWYPPRVKRALLITNPEATSVTMRTRDVITRALSSDLVVDLAETKRRGHAQHLAAGAVHEGYDLVLVLGGDGTLNEAINGLAGTETPLGILPGGGTNVFARTHGIPKDAVEATAALLERLREGAAPRRINLGKVNGRYFSFIAGVGFDAAVVRQVERRFRMKKAIGEWYFVSRAVRTYFFAYNTREAPMRIRLPDGTEHNGLRVAIAGNSNPFTFLGERQFKITPLADAERGLDITGVRSLGLHHVLRFVWRAFGSGGHIQLRNVVYLHDLGRFEVIGTHALPLQVDGDYVGEATRFEFTSERDALALLA